MAIYKCKMCGDDLPVREGQTVVECESCGTVQTIPTAGEEGLQRSFNRANALRRKGEFDKASTIYGKIVQADETQAEAYWGLILCKYGIEYVEDPKTLERKPTCHRASYDAVAADPDYKSALTYADSVQREVYEAEAREIDRIQKEILELSRKETPYDVFICYKETDEDGKRTEDSVIANDIYYELTNAGFKVFYAAITLEDKLGTAYEPCIFSALHSARVMLALGTKPEYFEAAWVKNEWSRYLKIMQGDRSKLLIPCYRDMDAYDLPEEFAHLQAQDMGKIGFVNDIIRGIRKVLQPEGQKPAEKREAPAAKPADDIAPLLERVSLYLEDGDFESADAYCERVLDKDPKNAQAYLGKLMADLHCRKWDDLLELKEPFGENANYKKAMRFGNNELKHELKNMPLEIKYRNAVNRMKTAKTEDDYHEAAVLFREIRGYKDAAEQAKRCEEQEKEVTYQTGLHLMQTAASVQDFEDAASCFDLVEGYKDADQKFEECDHAAKQIQYDSADREAQNDQDPDAQERAAGQFAGISGWKDAAERSRKCRERADEIRKERAAEEERRAKAHARKVRKVVAWIVLSAALVIAIICLLKFLVIPTVKAQREEQLREENYQKAEQLLAERKYAEALCYFDQADQYRNAEEMAKTLRKYVAPREAISAGSFHTVGLRSDGTVAATGKNDDGQCNVSEWTDIVAVSAGNYHTVGLRSDGTVVATGRNNQGQCDVSDWTDIVAISTENNYTVGLHADGTAVVTRYGQDVSGWTDMVAVSAGAYYIVGLRSDGTVMASGDNNRGQRNVSGWTDITAVSAGYEHTVGLRSDGTVVTSGDNRSGQCDVSDWTGIVAISARDNYTVGLHADGTAVVTWFGQDVSDWTDIAAITAGFNYTVGLRSNGTVVAAGKNDDGQCNVSSWHNIGLPEWK